MAIKETYRVRRIEYEDCKEWILYKHYAHRMPSICHAFGLYEDNILKAIVTYGMTVNRFLVKGAFGDDFNIPFMELNRLVASEDLPRNALSFLVGSSMRMLPRPMALVSYADSGQHHHGYIYQATNWVYTGMSSEWVDMKIKGMEDKHERNMNTKDGKSLTLDELKEIYGEENIVECKRSRKYRYFNFVGSKTDKRRLRNMLKYPILPYPKGDNERYDASYEPSVQLLLF